MEIPQTWPKPPSQITIRPAATDRAWLALWSWLLASEDVPSGQATGVSDGESEGDTSEEADDDIPTCS